MDGNGIKKNEGSQYTATSYGYTTEGDGTMGVSEKHLEEKVVKKDIPPAKPIDKDQEERNQRGNLVNNWKERVLSDVTKGIPLENLPDYIDYLGDTLAIKDRNMVAKFADTIKELANECTNKGLSSTITGKTGETFMYALFHCVKEGDGSVSITYAVHNIALEMQKKTLVSEHPYGSLSTEVEVEPPIKDMENYQKNKASDMLRKLGVDLDSTTGRQMKAIQLQIKLITILHSGQITGGTACRGAEGTGRGVGESGRGAGGTGHNTGRTACRGARKSNKEGDQSSKLKVDAEMDMN